MWHRNKKVLRTFAARSSQNAWAKIESLGWRRIRTGSSDGVTNVFVIMSAAKANGRKVDVRIDSVNGDQLISQAFLN